MNPQITAPSPTTLLPASSPGELRFTPMCSWGTSSGAMSSDGIVHSQVWNPPSRSGRRSHQFPLHRPSVVAQGPMNGACAPGGPSQPCLGRRPAVPEAQFACQSRPHTHTHRCGVSWDSVSPIVTRPTLVHLWGPPQTAGGVTKCSPTTILSHGIPHGHRPSAPQIHIQASILHCTSCSHPPVGGAINLMLWQWPGKFLVLGRPQ